MGGGGGLQRGRELLPPTPGPAEGMLLMLLGWGCRLPGPGTRILKPGVWAGPWAPASCLPGSPDQQLTPALWGPSCQGGVAPLWPCVSIFVCCLSSVEWAEPGSRGLCSPATPAPSLCHHYRPAWDLAGRTTSDPREEDALLRAEGQTPGDRLLTASLGPCPDRNSAAETQTTPWDRHARARRTRVHGRGPYRGHGAVAVVVCSGFTHVCESLASGGRSAGLAFPALERKSQKL